MTTAPVERIARWLSREVFNDAARDAITGLRLLDGSQPLQELTINAGDDATTLARELVDTLATYYDPVAERRGHTYHVAPVYREGARATVGKLPVKLTGETFDGLARAPTIAELSAAATQIGARAVDAQPVADNWRDQAKFNAQQVGLLTGTVVNLVSSVGAQHAAVFESLNATLALTQKALQASNDEAARLRSELAEEKRTHAETRAIAQEAVKAAEDLRDKLKTEREGSQLMAPIMAEVGKKAAAVVEHALTSGAITINGASTAPPNGAVQ